MKVKQEQFVFYYICQQVYGICFILIFAFFYFRIRVQHLECDIEAWKKTCDLSEVGLKNEFECNLLPTRCQRDPVFQSRLQQTCSVASFQRQLRNRASPSRTFSSVVITMVTMVVVLIL